VSRRDRVAVCSRSFSKNPVLRAELSARYERVTFNDAGLQLQGTSLVEFLRGHDKAITALERIDDFVLSRLPELKAIGKYGVSLHLPLDETTKNILCADRLALMKPSAILINTARGGLVDEAALKAALKDKRIAAAAFDVFTDEPPQDRELLALPNFLATPHI